VYKSFKKHLFFQKPAQQTRPHSSCVSQKSKRKNEYLHQFLKQQNENMQQTSKTSTHNDAFLKAKQLVHHKLAKTKLLVEQEEQRKKRDQLFESYFKSN